MNKYICWTILGMLYIIVLYSIYFMTTPQFNLVPQRMFNIIAWCCGIWVMIEQTNRGVDYIRPKGVDKH